MTTAAIKSGSLYDRFANHIGILSGIVLLSGIILQSSIFTINYDEVGLKARFGTLKEIAKPGLHLKLPFGIEKVEKVSASKIIVQEFGYRSHKEAPVSKKQLDAERSMITADLNIVETSMTVHYQIKDPINYVASVRNADQFIRSASEAIVSETVGQHQSGSLYTTSGQNISDMVRISLQDYLDHFNVGVIVRTVEIREITPPENVRSAFDKVNEAQQEKERRISEAKRLANRKVSKAKALAEGIRAEAQTEALRRQTESDGKIKEYITYHTAFLKDPEIVKTDLYVTNLAEILPLVNSVIITNGNTPQPLSLLDIKSKKQD